MHENKVKIGLWFVAFATLFIIGVFVSIFVFSNEKGSITETLKKERALYDPYQTLKNKEIREVNKNWKAFWRRTGIHVGLFVVRYEDELSKIEKEINFVGSDSLFIMSAHKDDVISFKMGKDIKCPSEKWAEHLKLSTLRMMKLSAADVASDELMAFLETHCLENK